MPYEGQVAGKTGHKSILDNEDLTEFLAACDYLKEPGEEELSSIQGQFKPVKPTSRALPSYTLASDGSLYESSISEDFPSTRVGYLKISQIVVDMEIYQRLADHTQRFIDPFELNKLQEKADALTITLPSTNLRYKNSKTVKDGFRRKLFEIMLSENMQLEGYPLLDTLYFLASKSKNHGIRLDTGERVIFIYKCPQCGYQPEEQKPAFEIPNGIESKTCHECECQVYASDVLRLHYEIQDFESNASVFNRVMNAFEHLLMAHYINYLVRNDPGNLSEMCFMMDGPLAVFGPPAWLRGPMQRLIYEANKHIVSQGFEPFLVLGLEKTGQVVEHFNLLVRCLQSKLVEESEQSFLDVLKGRVMSLTDNYRDKYVKQREPNYEKNFGEGTYYGQHFLYLSNKGNPFVFTLPYPFPDKSSSEKHPFRKEKAKLEHYPDIERALRLISLFEADLYQSSVVPVILAHGEASISLVPGGKVLDLVSLQKFKGKRKSS